MVSCGGHDKGLRVQTSRAGMLAYKCGPAFAGLTGAVIAAYTAFTIGITQWRTRFRQAMNKADSEAGKQAMDSLINFETVKLYGNEEHELKRYDRCLAGASLYKILTREV